jgi:hypothetical protein
VSGGCDWDLLGGGMESCCLLSWARTGIVAARGFFRAGWFRAGERIGLDWIAVFESLMGISWLPAGWCSAEVDVQLR